MRYHAHNAQRRLRAAFENAGVELAAFATIAYAAALISATLAGVR